MKYKIMLLVIIILASILRLWDLGGVPPSPDWDEAALGYNAYSLLQTGKDEYGETFPMVLISFGDYKPALYAYLIIPFITIFDLSDIAVRLPSALFGILAVVSTYFLVRELFTLRSREKHPTEDGKWKLIIPLLASLLLAVSPWHIQFSRVAFEANVGLTFNILTATCFVIGLRNKKLFVFSALFAALSIYTYQSEKIFTPLLVIALAIIYRKELLIFPRKWLLAAIVVGVVISAPMVFFTFSSDHGLARAQGTSVFSSKDDLLKYSIQKLERDQNDNNLIGKVFDNRRVEYTKLIISGYFAHFSPNWLFITGDADRHHAPYMGLLYIWELPFLLVGLYSAIFSQWMRKHKKSQKLIFTWFILAPVPAAITNDVPHAVRTLNFLPTFQIFIAIGMMQAYLYFRHYKKSFIFIISLFILFISLNTTYFLNQYFVQQNYFYSEHWQYGYKEAVIYVSENQDKYEKIIVSDRVPLDQSYIFFLYYTKYPPQEYQATQGQNHSFGKFEFRPVQWKTDETLQNTLFVGAPGEFPEVIPADRSIYYLNGEPAIKIVSTR